jgi:hypothetical protein
MRDREPIEGRLMLASRTLYSARESRDDFGAAFIGEVIDVPAKYCPLLLVLLPVI